MLSLSTVVLLLAVTVPSDQQQCDQRFINNVMDFVLEQLTTKYPDSVDLPDVTKSFFLNTLIFELSYGSVSGLSTMKRVGDMEIGLDDGEMDIALTVSFENLTVSYDAYRIRALVLQRTGSLTTSVMDNLIRVSASMRERSLCLVDIGRVELLYLGDFHVDLNTNCHICNTLGSWISNKILNFFKKSVRMLVEYKIDSVLRTVLSPSKNSMVCRNLNF